MLIPGQQQTIACFEDFRVKTMLKHYMNSITASSRYMDVYLCINYKHLSGRVVRTFDHVVPGSNPPGC